MDDMDVEIKALNTRVDKLMMRMNITILIGLIGLILTLYKLFSAVQYPQVSPPTNTNSVQIGGAEQPKPQREYLDSDEVGEREGVTSRTVISWIEQGRIYPQPTRQGRAWVIAADYRILTNQVNIEQSSKFQ